MTALANPRPPPPRHEIASVDVALGARRRLHVALDERDRLSLRKWFVGPDGQWRPSHHGLDVPANAVGAIVAALLRLARAMS